MKTQIKILAVIFIILTIGIYVLYGNDRGPEKQQDKMFFAFDQDQIDSFQINNFTLGLLFQKKDGAWQVKRVKNQLTKDLEKKAKSEVGEFDKDFADANSLEVAKSITYLATLKNLRPISTESKLPGTFEINEFSLHVIFLDKDRHELDRVYIGKPGPDPFTSFIKKKDSNHVYLADQDFRALLLRKYEEWLPKEKIAK